eukprot:11756857-Ditylum_brightwellii.AAC.1
MGMSKEAYSHSKLYPIYSSGQGAMNSPNISLVISSTLADIYNREAHSTIFISPEKKTNTKLTILILLDDVANQVDDFIHKNLH